jgi:hypothetical protein
MRWSVVILCLAQAACALSDGTPIVASNAPDAAAMARAIQQVATAEKLPPPLEVSDLRGAHPISPAEWMFCLKSMAPDQLKRYAVFMKNNDVVNFRTGVLIDRCDSENYKPVKAP